MRCLREEVVQREDEEGRRERESPEDAVACEYGAGEGRDADAEYARSKGFVWGNEPSLHLNVST